MSEFVNHKNLTFVRVASRFTYDDRSSNGQHPLNPTPKLLIHLGVFAFFVQQITMPSEAGSDSFPSVNTSA